MAKGASNDREAKASNDNDGIVHLRATVDSCQALIRLPMSTHDRDAIHILSRSVAQIIEKPDLHSRARIEKLYSFASNEITVRELLSSTSRRAMKAICVVLALILASLVIAFVFQLVPRAIEFVKSEGPVDDPVLGAITGISIVGVSLYALKYCWLMGIFIERKLTVLLAGRYLSEV